MPIHTFTRQGLPRYLLYLALVRVVWVAHKRLSWLCVCVMKWKADNSAYTKYE